MVRILRRNSRLLLSGCQRNPWSFVALAVVLVVLAAGPARGRTGLGAGVGLSSAAAKVKRPFTRADSRSLYGWSKALPWQLSGSFSLNWRNVGPRTPGFETQIQNEIYLADMYFAFHGPIVDQVPLMLEFNMRTGGQGAPRLYRFFFQYDRIDNLDFRFGKFLVPFGRYNELYRPDMFLTVTRPLLYASPDSLDLVVRLNSPRPAFSSGYADIGMRTSYYPPHEYALLPRELTFFVVNGLGESANRIRTFPKPENLGIEPPLPSGVTLDFGHENNNLADNNNNKALGGRIVWALGALALPWPIPEGKRDLNGTYLGLSAMGGQFDLEAGENYSIYGVDIGFEWEGVNVSTEYLYSFTQLRAPLVASPGATTLKDPLELSRDFEENHGYFIQVSLPLWRNPWWGKRVTGIFVYNRIFRRGPELDLLTNQNIDGTDFPSIAAKDPTRARISRLITKVTAAANWQLSDHFLAKGEYSYWVMGNASTITGTRDIYQGAFSIVLAF